MSDDARLRKAVTRPQFRAKNCAERKGIHGWGRDELLAMCRNLGIAVDSKANKGWLCARLTRYFEKNEKNEKQKAHPAGAGALSAEKKITVKELRELCKSKSVKGYSRMTKAQLIRACWGDRKKSLDEKHKVSLGDNLAELEGSLQDNATDLASSLAGMLWLLRKYRNKVCVALKPSSLRYPEFGEDFCDFCVCWYASSKTIKWTFVKHEEAFWEVIQDWCETQFVIVPVYLVATKNDNEYRHYNYMIVDRSKKQIERFEPYGIYDNSLVDRVFQETALDKLLEKSAKTHGYSYLAASAFCPRLGVQAKEELQKQFAVAGDPVGFCSFWSLWYADRRLRHPAMEPKMLVEKLTEEMETKQNIKKFIRTFAHFIDTEKRRIVQRAKEYETTNHWTPARAVTEALLWEIMYSTQLR